MNMWDKLIYTLTRLKEVLAILNEVLDELNKALEKGKKLLPYILAILGGLAYILQ